MKACLLCSIITAVTMFFCVSRAYAVATSDSTTWEGLYEADVLPDEAGFASEGTVALFTSLTGDGTIRLNNLTEFQPAHLGWWQQDPQFDFATGASVEFRAKVNDPTGDPNAMILEFHDAANTEMIRFRMFGTDQVQISYGATPTWNSIPVVTSEYHTYRFTVGTGSNNVNVYIDGNPTPAATGTLLSVGGSVQQSIMFGDGTTVADGNGDWSIDYLRWTAEGAFTFDSLEGDLNSDGFVGIADLNIVLGNWNQTIPPGDPLADPSGDDFVGIADLNVVLGNWNAGTPPSDEQGSSVIPEPTVLTLITVGIAVPLLRHRRVAI